MKLVSNLLESIEGIRIYYIIGLLIFVALFIVILVRTLRMPKKEIENIKNSILNDNDSEMNLPTK
ncbi:MAG: CcoQ/FixQ family Cbb3-type cytochrome c oxidase assembly chaperone [Draconibacterium sp.]|nr:MAG: CcoQ/FixQ family Cbb3-type cytochrome c oxidase assembly chaperone [Draconibacterium sp.]